MGPFPLPHINGARVREHAVAPSILAGANHGTDPTVRDYGWHYGRPRTPAVRISSRNL